MSKIVFFSIPAYGHTNPTIEVINELTKRGHKVKYYSFDIFKEKIENAGAEYISCDSFLPSINPNETNRIGKDFSMLLEMILDVTFKMNDKVYAELNKFKPDCIVSDSMSLWGKLFALNLNIPFICSTTTFAFNEYSSRSIKHGFKEFFYMIKGMPKVNKKLKRLRGIGYNIPSIIDIVKNDNNTNTIVFTSSKFQPMSEIFSNKYHFVGPSIADFTTSQKTKVNKLIYISLGTVNNKNNKFYYNCIEAFKDYNAEIIMSIGESTDISQFNNAPSNFTIMNHAPQIEILQKADVFITHSGMNSVNESLYCCVPMIFFPQQSEQFMVANRAVELGTGIFLKKNNPSEIRNIVTKILSDPSYKKNAEIISKSFREAGGSKKAADIIEHICTK